MSSCNTKIVPEKDANAVNDVAHSWNPIVRRVDAKGCTNMLQHTLQHTVVHCSTLQHALQHTLRHTATHYSTATHAQGCMCVWHDTFICVT